MCCGRRFRPSAGRLHHPEARAVRHWMVIVPKGELVCLTVYKRGAQEAVRRLAA
jgi:hypothetical protein